MSSATFNLPKQLDEKLREQAEAKFISKSAYIRQLLAAAVGMKSAPAPSKKGGRK
jgi:Arc/MetJ-type ribon-helix-helix transcriptional regulator